MYVAKTAVVIRYTMYVAKTAVVIRYVMYVAKTAVVIRYIIMLLVCAELDNQCEVVFVPRSVCWDEGHPGVGKWEVLHWEVTHFLFTDICLGNGQYIHYFVGT